MSAGWVKWEKDLETDPRFMRYVRRLRNTCVTQGIPEIAVHSLACGLLLRLWSFADSHIRADDVLDMGTADIDDMLGVPGFCEALPEDWIVPVDEGHVELPNFQTHNGVQAKKTAMSQKRMARKRSRDREAEEERQRNAGVTGASPDQTRPDQTKREEPARVTGGEAETPTLDAWRRDVPECSPEAFGAWIAHCESKGKRMDAGMRLLQARTLSQQGDTAAQVYVTTFCIENGYKTLIPIRDVRARREGMTKGRAGPGVPGLGAPGGPVQSTSQETALRESLELERLKKSRGAMGVPNFRDPHEHESSAAYQTAINTERSRTGQVARGEPRRFG